MTPKRFFIRIDKKNGVGLFDGDLRLMYIQFSNIESAKSCEDALIYQCNLMNELHEENQRQKAYVVDTKIQNLELINENEQLKAQLKDCEKRVTDKEVEWLRNNTVWEQMPSNRRTFFTTTSGKEDYK